MQRCFIEKTYFVKKLNFTRKYCLLRFDKIWRQKKTCTFHKKGRKKNHKNK